MSEKFEQWAIVELFGHQKVAGFVTEQSVGGCAFIRVDIPAFEDSPAMTRLYTQGAIYGMSFVSEQIARAAAQSYRVAPISAYDLRHMIGGQQRELIGSNRSEGDDDDGRF